MTPLRIAIIGAGHLGRIHARLLSGIDDVEVVAITDPSDAARQTVSQQLGVPTYASHTQVIDRIDAAVIAAPTGLHAGIADDLLAAGKHLFVEKPITISPNDAQKLVDRARREELILQVGHVERFNPAWSAASDVLDKPKYIEATRASSFPGRCLDVGVVLDLMIHDIDLVLSVTDAELVDVQASGLSVVSDHEDLAETRLTFACGLVANLKASRVSLTANRLMQVYGPNGFAEIDFSIPKTTLVLPSGAIRERSFALDDLGDPRTARDILFQTQLKVETPNVEPRNAILDELHDFLISIRSGVEPTVTGSAGARAVEVADRILCAINERRWNGALDISARGPHAAPMPRYQRRVA